MHHIVVLEEVIY